MGCLPSLGNWLTVAWREEQAPDGISETGLAGVSQHIILVNIGKNRAGNEVPIFVHRERHYGLHVHPVLESITVRSSTEIELDLFWDLVFVLWLKRLGHALPNICR